MQAQELHPTVERLLCEYKEGFNGIVEAVASIKDMSDETQKKHLTYKELIIKEQLKFVVSQERKLIDEIRMVLARVNVQWLQISTMKETLIEQMNECTTLKEELEKVKETVSEESEQDLKQDTEGNTIEKTK